MKQNENATTQSMAFGPIAVRVGLAVLLFVFVFLLFSPSLRYGFVGIDDYDYIPANPLFRDGPTAAGTIHFMYTTIQQGMYAPLLWMSYWLDTRLLGASYDNARGFHLANVVLHALNALVLYWMLLFFCKKPWRSFFWAALWAFHPLRVESVAWIASRKDVLSGFFGLLCLSAYVLSWQGTHGRRPRIAVYIASIACLALGLLAKSALVSFPFVLVLLDFWPLRRVKGSARSILRNMPNLLAEKAPFFFLSALSVVGTIHAHKAVHALAEAPLSIRLMAVPVHYVFYLSKTFIPYHFSPLYPDLSFSFSLFLLSGVLLLLLTAFAWRHRHQHPYVVTGWIFFLVTLLPTIGLIRFGLQSVADRYTYVPAMGLSLAALACWPSRMASRTHARIMRIGMSGAVLIFLAVGTLRLLPAWHSSHSLFTHMLSVNPDNPRALGLHAAHLIETKGDFRAAKKQYDRIFEAHTLTPGDVDGNARCLAALQGAAEAFTFLRRAPMPLDAASHRLRLRDLARYALAAGQYDEAILYAQQARDVLPEDPSMTWTIHLVIMTAAFEKRDPELALIHARHFPAYGDKTHLEFKDLLPYYLQQWNELHRSDAHTFFKRLLDAQPQDIGLLNNIAWGLATANWSPAPPDAVVDLAERAQRALPDHPGVWDTLAAAQANAGDFASAIRSLNGALERVPDGDDPRAIDFRDGLMHRLALYERKEPYREEAFARLMAARFGEGLPLTRKAVP